MEDISAGFYRHTEIRAGLCQLSKNPEVNQTIVTGIQLHIDRLHLFGRSNMRLWTILSRLVHPLVSPPILESMY